MNYTNLLLKIYFSSSITIFLYNLITKPKKEHFKNKKVFKKNIFIYLIFIIISIILFTKKEYNINSSSISNLSDIFLIN